MKRKNESGLILRNKVIFVFSLVSVLVIACFAMADTSNDCIDVWVMCNPDSFVNIRVSPSTRSETEGYLMCCDKVLTDGQTKNGFLHCYCTNESGEGWVYSGYIVTDEPVIVNEVKHIESNGRVAARSNIAGDRNCWLKDGREIYVFCESEEWCVTSKGFVKTEFISY